MVKTTLARQLAADLGYPYVEIDSLFHGPAWTRRAEFEADVDDFSAQPWNANVAPSLWTIFTDPEHVVRWAWTRHHRHRDLVIALLTRRPEVVVVRLRSPRQVGTWVNGPLRTMPP